MHISVTVIYLFFVTAQAERWLPRDRAKEHASVSTAQLGYIDVLIT